MADQEVEGYLGIDIGTQGLTVLLTDVGLKVLATGEATYGFVDGLDDGCYEQDPQAWTDALHKAMLDLRRKVSDFAVIAIGISGQMHGEVLVGASGVALGPARLWCDARNEDEGSELTKRFGAKVPKRATCARFLWTVRNRPEVARRVRHLTTPAGWIAYHLTGEWNLGVGDAAGMFPIDPNTRTYSAQHLESYDKLVDDPTIPSISAILPNTRLAGQDAGRLTEAAARWLGLRAGIPVAPAEGDQVAALAGSLIGRPGLVSCSFGTSVCANVVSDDRAFEGVSPAVDHFCSADGRPIHMVWLRNGTTFLNSIVESYGTFEAVMPQLVDAPPDCGGLLALPFMDDEPGLLVDRGGSACIVGWNAANAKAGNAAKASLLSTMFNLRLGCQALDQQGYPRTEIILSGGLTKTPECGQILADVFRTPVVLLDSAEEGCSWGAALLAKYRHLNGAADWPAFLDEVADGTSSHTRQRFVPDAAFAAEYDRVFEKYKALLQLQPQLTSLGLGAVGSAYTKQ
jgi:sugar (pentulose or hexulose) kinase